MKKIPFYTSSKGHKVWLRPKKARPFSESVKNAFRPIYGFCFNVGYFLINSAKNFVESFSKIAKKLFKNTLREVAKTRQALRIRAKIFNSKIFSGNLSLFVLFCLIGIFLFASFEVGVLGFEFKNKIFNSLSRGKGLLENTKAAVDGDGLMEMQSRFASASLAFGKAQEEIQSADLRLKLLVSVIPQGQDLKKLVVSAKNLTEAGEAAARILTEASEIKFSTAGISNPEKATEVFKSSAILLGVFEKKISEAEKNLREINSSSIPAENRSEFLELREKVSVLRDTFSNLSSLSEIFKGLFMGNQKILVLFQNNNELRASGGFIGTYGDFEVKDGHIEKMKISSVYDLDGQLKEKILPPRPILSVNDRWFLRDANWFADFPQSAKKVSGFFEKEAGETPDSVIAVTPELISDLLGLVGPVELPREGLILDRENFVEKIQAASTAYSEKPVNEPKQVLADLVPVLFEKIQAGGTGIWLELGSLLSKNFAEKQLVIYSRHEKVQKELSSFGWTGEIHGADRDYLSVNSSNLGGTKTDLGISQSVALKTKVETDGSVINELSITRTNTWPKGEIFENESFLRIFVPKGSQLISAAGFDRKNLEFFEHQKNYKPDVDARRWEETTVQQLSSGTIVGEESDKTFFGNWVKLSGGETRVLRLVYKTPLKLSGTDRYSLLLQEQIGQKDQEFTLNISFPGRKMHWMNFSPQVVNSSEISHGIIQTKDLFFGFVLQKTDFQNSLF